ncbi:hypothetical protein Ciccas_013078, partial [Cichlidogyrus casuarinus]
LRIWISLQIGIIGGSGIYDLEFLTERKQHALTTPYGEPSDVMTLGLLDGVECVWLPRHDRAHRIMPSKINYRANIWALYSLGCTHILATSAAGSLQEHIKPGDFVILDDFYDQTKQRKTTFYEGEIGDPSGVLHIPGNEPFCVETRLVLKEACKRILSDRLYQSRVHEQGCVVVVEGPRLSSKSESKVFHSLGFDVINMSTIPEVLLAKELGICYAMVALVTDWDSWNDSKQSVTFESVAMQLKDNIHLLGKIVREAVKVIKEREQYWPLIYQEKQ